LGAGAQLSAARLAVVGDKLVVAGSYQGSFANLPTATTRDGFLLPLKRVLPLVAEPAVQIAGDGVTVTALGGGAQGVVVGGTTMGSVLDSPAMSGMARDGWLARFDLGGQGWRWSSRIGGADAQAVTDVAFAPDGEVVMLGSSTGAATVADRDLAPTDNDGCLMARFTVEGKALWAEALSSPGVDDCTQLAVDAWGNTLVAITLASGGAVYRGAPLGLAGQKAGLLLALDPNGDVSWSYRASGPGPTALAGIATAHRHSLIFGAFTQELALDGTSIVTGLGQTSHFAAFLVTP
jgi:hypothetical protein